MIFFRKFEEKIAYAVLTLMTAFILFVLGTLLFFVLSKGVGVLSISFLTESPRMGMTEGGIFPAIIGTLYLTLGSLLIALPLGICSAIYLVEYARQSFFVRLINMAINNLAGVPSIVFGLFGLALFVKYCNFDTSILSGSLTLGCLILPVIIRTSQEALAAVPPEDRHGALALGATQWHVIHTVVLPQAVSGILTGTIISVGRAAGETAAILFTAAAFFYPKLPTSVLEPVMALPYHLYVIATSGIDLDKTRPLAFGTALVLIVMVFTINLGATYLRARSNLKLGRV